MVANGIVNFFNIDDRGACNKTGESIARNATCASWSPSASRVVIGCNDGRVVFEKTTPPIPAIVGHTADGPGT